MPPRGPKTPAKRKAEGAGPSTPIKLQYEEDDTRRHAALSAQPRPVDHLIPPRSAPHSLSHNEDLVFMALDIVEEAGGARFQVWGVTPSGASVCLRIDDFCHSFYIAAPRRPVPATWGKPSSGFDPNVHDELIDWDQGRQLETLRSVLNSALPHDSKVRSIQPVHRRPIMYYRPGRPEGETYLCLTLDPSGNARRAGSGVQRLISGRDLQSYGMVWRDKTVYEFEVAPLQRFLADVPLSSGAWVCIPPAHPAGGPSVATPAKGGGPGPGARPGQPGGGGGGGGGFTNVPTPQKVSKCAIEVHAPWRSIVCLTPDATQLADAAWDPFDADRQCGGAPSEQAQQAAEAAKKGDLPPLRMMVMDVVAATRDGRERAPVPAQGDPIVAISCAVYTDHASALGGGSDEVIDLTGEGEEAAEVGGGGGAVVASSPAAVMAGPTSAQHAHRPGDGGRQCSAVFALAAHAADKEVRELDSGATVVVCATEAELLLSWHAFFHAADPDILALFQVGDTLEAIAQRFGALRLGGGALRLSRHAPASARPVQIKKVTMYSAAWVRSQSRMSSTSNQETFKAEVEGRWVVDVLRHCLTACNLASFSLVDCVQTLLGETLEVLGAHSVAALAGMAPGAAPRPLRMARYSMRRVAAVQALLGRLAVIPEALEMARATGLTVGQVMYQAQMVRSHSLILRSAAAMGFLVGGRQEAVGLAESPWLLHPVQHGTTGLHREPVAILDFASLYPSIYRAYNLCYTTLIHPEDADAVSPDHVITTPTGAKFVAPSVRPGILPSILAALISARATTRAQLRDATDPAQRAVLDSRQKALKVTANALYGFTGAQASPLQCVPLADSCLAYGAASCRQARNVLEAAAADGRLGPGGAGARVIYGHTDSLFVSLPRAGDVAAAIRIGHVAAAAVSAAFPPPMELKFERVCAPLLLLHVNRYAGRAYEKEEDRGELIVKGLKSMWRQTAPLLRTTLHGALVRILMDDDVPGAVTFVEGEIRRLLTGKVSLHELVMTGGLWRVTGEQIQAAGAGEGAGGAEAGEEVRGPHASLAVRLSQRDPGRAFVLGERLQFVLTAGHKLQDDAAEDPLTAARAGTQPDLELYWRNKLQRPLTEIFATCLTPSQLQSLISGPHTLVKVDVVQPRAGGAGAGAGPSGPASPSPSARRGGGGGGGGRQLGMMAFYRTTAKCLGCRATMHAWKGAAEDAPGLCDACTRQDGRRGEALLGLLGEEEAQEARRCAAYAACRQCDSGTIEEAVLCDNGECPVTYERLGSAAALRSVGASLRRLNIA